MLYRHINRELQEEFPKSVPNKWTYSPSDEGHRAPTSEAGGPPSGKEGSDSPIKCGDTTLKDLERSKAWNQLSTVRGSHDGKGTRTR